MSLRLSVVFAILTGVASAQSPAPTQERTLYFEPTITAEGFQEIVNAVRTITAIQSAPIDEARKSLALSGTAAQVETAEWLFPLLNKPSGGTPKFTLPGAPDQMVEVLYPANINTSQGLAELVNTIRTVAEIQRMFVCNETRTLAVRGTAGQAALAEWLVNALDKPADWQPPESERWASYDYSASLTRGDTASAVRVFYTAHAEKPQDIAEVVNLTRTIAEVQRMFACNERKAIVVRGAPNQVNLAEWLLNALDKPAGWQPPASQNPARYQYQEDSRVTKSQTDFVRIFYLPPTGTPQDLQATAREVRTATGCQRVFPDDTHHAIALRGTASQVTAAEQLIAAQP